MIKINKNALHSNAKLLFEILLNSPELSEFTLVGGNAMALQIRHRVALNFDFAYYEQILPCNKIDDFIFRLKEEGFTVHDLTDSNDVALFKVNTGENLRDYSRDYIVNGIKITFFVQGRTLQQRDFFKNCEKIKSTGMLFNVLGIDGLKVAKILLLAERVRSRDLFDLMILVKDHSLTLDKLDMYVKTLGHIDDPEHYRAVLTGIIPLDNSDEGLKPVNLDFNIESIYQFFDQAYEENDIKKACELYSKNQ